MKKVNLLRPRKQSNDVLMTDIKEMKEKDGEISIEHYINGTTPSRDKTKTTCKYIAKY